jgi:hypothetical protein
MASILARTSYLIFIPPTGHGGPVDTRDGELASASTPAPNDPTAPR